MLIAQGEAFDLGAAGVGGNQGTSVALADGSVFVVWQNTVSAFFPGPGTDVEGSAIVGTVIGADGATVVAPFQINQVEPSFQTDPQLTVLENGNVVIAWTDAPFGDAGQDAKARIFTPAGTAVSDEITLSTVTEDDQRIPDVAATPDGGFLAMWNDDRAEVYGQYFDAAGARVGEEFLAPAGFGQRFSSTVIDDGGIRYVSDNQFWSSDGVVSFNEVLQLNTILASSVSTLNTGFQGQYITDIEALPDNRFVILGVSRVGADYQVQARVQDGSNFDNGIIVEGNAGNRALISDVLPSAADFGVYPDVTPLSNGGYVATWTQNTAPASEPANYDIFALAVGPDLVASDMPIRLTSDAAPDSQPFATELSGGEVLIGWTDTSTTISEVPSALIGQLFAISGSGNGGGGGAPGDPIIGTDADDTLLGTTGDDVISGGDGNDNLSGEAGDDTIAGSAGADTINGGDGNDMIGGGTEGDLILGGAGNDTIGAGQGDDDASGGDGNDIVNGGGGNDTLQGNSGNDTMGASFGADQVNGGLGDDDMGGGTGMDVIFAGFGNDSVGGGEGDDLIFGEDGDDFLAGGGRDDTIDGGAGDDRINAGDGDDRMTGGIGADLFIFNGFRDGDEDIITDFENGVDSFRMTGVETAPGTGNEGRVAALNIVDTEDGALITYQGHTILLAGVMATDLGVEDFVFI